MIIYEMIYHLVQKITPVRSSIKRITKSLDVISLIRFPKDTRQTLSDYLADPYFNKELDAYVIEAFEEEIEALNHMKVEFIKNGRVNHSSYVSTVVAERLVKDV